MDVSLVDSMIAEITQHLDFKHEVGWGEILQKKYRFVMLVGMGLSIFQEITGINVVVYYSGMIFHEVGFSNQHALLVSAGITFPQLLMIALGLRLIDKLGRRTILLFSLYGMTAGLGILGFAFFNLKDPFEFHYDAASHGLGSGLDKWLAGIGMLTFRAAFSMGLGPIPLMIASEIYPLRIRGKAMAIAGMVNWLFNFGITQTYLDLMTHIGACFTYGIYLIITILCIVFTATVVPETKGKSLEELEASLTQL